MVVIKEKFEGPYLQRYLYKRLPFDDGSLYP